MKKVHLFPDNKSMIAYTFTELSTAQRYLNVAFVLVPKGT